MVVFPNCKINLGLTVTNKREDGYHDIETVFYPVALSDALEIIPIQLSDNSKYTTLQHLSEKATKVSFNSSGLPIKGTHDENLCVKAYHLLKKDFPQLPAVAIHLHKVIPMGAGLGGGSSDGSFTLTLMNQVFQLNLSKEMFEVYALSLGSDCPFFISNKPCFAKGRGEILQEIPLNLSAYEFVIVNPGIHVSTAEAFAQIIPTVPKLSLLKIIEQPLINWKNLLINDFEMSVSKSYPAIAQIKEQLYSMGAIYASMSGSGSSVFGIFEKNQIINFSKNFPHAVFHIK